MHVRDASVVWVVSTEAVALRADEALVLPCVETKVPLAGLASGGARQMGAARGCGVHACPPSIVGERTKRSMARPPFALQVHLTTVKCRATTVASRHT